MFSGGAYPRGPNFSAAKWTFRRVFKRAERSSFCGGDEAVGWGTIAFKITRSESNKVFKYESIFGPAAPKRAIAFASTKRSHSRLRCNENMWSLQENRKIKREIIDSWCLGWKTVGRRVADKPTFGLHGVGVQGC